MDTDLAGDARNASARAGRVAADAGADRTGADAPAPALAATHAGSGDDRTATAGGGPGAPRPAALDLRTLRRRMVWALVLAILLYVALAAYGDLDLLRRHLVEFPWTWLPAILGLTLVNYVGRLLKWLWYLRLVGSPIATGDGARIFGIGMTMVLTPGKAGELLKSYMVRAASGTPMSVTAPIVLSERLTDGLAMLVLSGIGLLGFHDPALRRAAVLLLVAMAAVVLSVRVRPLWRRIIGVGERTPGVRRFAASMHTFYDSSYRILAPRNLAIAVSIGVVSWTCEGLAYFLVLRGVAPDLAATPENALRAVFVFSICTILGAVAATPGGLGATEAGLVALSQRLFALDPAAATAAALIARLATLWFGVGLGLVSLARWPHLLDEGSGDGGRATRPTAGSDRPTEPPAVL